ncbi:MAG: hypothetical protein KDJ52_08010 [Anaerolineae bacterium]|nr:hypothetical protein [Anaerolineae bacterium]
MSAFYLGVEPNNIEVSGKDWVQEEFIFTNRHPETYQNVVITMRPAWPINLKQTKHLLGHLDPGVSKAIKVEVMADSTPGGETYNLPLTISVDGKPPQKFSLTVSTVESRPSLEENEMVFPPVSPGEKKQPLPDIKEFRRELNKLATDHLEQLCDNNNPVLFDDIFFNNFLGAQMSNAKRVTKIIDYCKRRKKFPELYQAMKDMEEDTGITFFK